LDEVMHLFVAFQLEQLRDGDTPYSQTPQVAAFEIGNHDQLGDFLNR
jgi:hypothetical protein